MNLARFNHVLIPGTKAERDRLRETRMGRVLFEPLARTYRALSPEGRALFMFVCFAGFAGLDVMRSQNSTLWALLFTLIVTSLAMRRLFALAGVTLSVEVPARITAGDEARFSLVLEHRGERTHHAIRVAGPLLPWDGTWTGARGQVAQLEPGERARVALSARFDARGRHEIDPFQASALVPLRLVQGPPVWTRGARFVVVPRIASLRQLKLPQSPRYQPGGVALASLTGEAMELVGVRPYRNGDRLRDLHARTWARTGEPAVREYHQEYFSRVGVVLDTDLACADDERLEAAISLAAGVVARLSRGEALIDLLVTGDQLHPLTLGRSLGCLEQALDHLACVEPGPPFASAHLLQLLRPFLGRLSSVVLVCLGWDTERSALERAIAGAGIGCRSLVVTDGAPGDDTARPAGVCSVSRADVESACGGGPELSL